MTEVKTERTGEEEEVERPALRPSRPSRAAAVKQEESSEESEEEERIELPKVTKSGRKVVRPQSPQSVCKPAAERSPGKNKVR